MLLVIILAIITVFAWLTITRQMTMPFFYRVVDDGYWSIGTVCSDNPLVINTNSISVIDYNIQKSHPNVCFMSDPFIVEENGIYYIFYEYFPYKWRDNGGEVAALKSTDLKNWESLGVVLDENFHLSYPQIFKIKDNWYMIPETNTVNEIRLYTTNNFPHDWEYKKSLVKNRKVLDPTLIIKDDIFYLLGEENKKLCLFFSNNLEGEWQEHPQSPVRQQDTRPGGSPVVLNGKIIYFIQDHTYSYGTGLVSYEIDSISPTCFADHRIDIVLWRFGDDWAANGMHQLSAIQLSDGSWFCVVDGWQKHGKYYGWDWLNFPKINLKKK